MHHSSSQIGDQYIREHNDQLLRRTEPRRDYGNLEAQKILCNEHPVRQNLNYLKLCKVPILASPVPLAGLNAISTRLPDPPPTYRFIHNSTTHPPAHTRASAPNPTDTPGIQHRPPALHTPCLCSTARRRR
jgi:hypothetical protein